MTLAPTFRRAGIVLLLTWLSIELHELGHFLVYTFSGVPAHITFQRVHPLVPVPALLDHWAKGAGPAASIALAVACLIMVRRRPGFGWATAAFTNASIRIFPLVMDLLRAVKGGAPFSDEGEIARALASGRTARVALLLIPLGVTSVLTVLAGREYRGDRSRLGTALAVYFLSLAFGIGFVVLDEVLGLNGP